MNVIAHQKPLSQHFRCQCGKCVAIETAAECVCCQQEQM